MALIHVYKGLSKQTEKYTFTGKLRDNLPIDWDNAVLLNSGEAITPDYEVQPDDVIFIRMLPTAAATWITVGLITGGVLLLGGGIYAGVSLYNKQKEVQNQLDKAQKASKAAAETINRLPYVRGARNAAATGQTIPYIIGETLYTPMRLAPPHITIAGTNGEQQYYDFILECGYNDILIKRVKLGDTVIKSFTDTRPQSGVYSWDNGIYYDSRNIIEIQQREEFTTAGYNEKVVLAELNKEIPHDHGDTEKWAAGVVQPLASNAMGVEVIALFDGLRRYDDGWKSQTITLKPQWCNNPDDTAPDWHDFDEAFNQNGSYSNTFSYNTKNQLRFTARQNFTAEQSYGKKISVRVIRTTAKAESNSNDTVYLIAVQTYCYDAKKSNGSTLVPAKVLEDTERSKCCRMGVRIAANDNTSGLLDAISIEAAGVAQVWNGTAWSEEKQPTRNLAAWAREIMLSDKHTPSQFNPEELDAETWGEWYDYCQQQGFNADGVITKAEKKENTINTLCANSNAALFLNPMTGKIEVAIDNGRDYSVALLNSDTIQSISTQREYKRKPTGKKVTYINRAADYEIDNVIFMRNGGQYVPAVDTLTTTALQYVTDYSHAYKIAWRQLAEENAQPRTVTVKVGPEAAYYPLYSRVELQHKSLKNGITHAQIKELTWYAGRLQTVKLMAPVTVPAEPCGLLISCVSDTVRGLLPIKVSGDGVTDTLAVLDTVKTSDDLQPFAGNFCSFGKLDEKGDFTTVTASMKIINAEETDNGYTLTLVDYNPALYEYGQLPEYKSNINTTPTAEPAKPIEQQREYITAPEAEALNTGAAVDAAQAAVDTVSHGFTFKNAYTLKPAGETLEEIIAKIDDDARNANASISISEEEILLQVNDVERELRGALSVQAGAVQAIVEGGGAVGSLALSLQLPAVIDSSTRAKLVQAATEAKVNAVYALVVGGDYYVIKETATPAQVKTLWDAAVSAGLLASQLDLSATQINIAAEHIKITSGYDRNQLMIEDGKIRASLLDANEILAKNATISGTLTLGQRGDNMGLIKSSNFNGSFDEDGNFKSYGQTGYAVTKGGDAAFNSIRVFSANIHDSIIRSRRFYTFFSWSDTYEQVKTTLKTFMLNIKEYYESVVKIDQTTSDYFIGSMVVGVSKRTGGQTNYHATGFKITNNFNYINLAGFHCSKHGADGGNAIGSDVEIYYMYNSDDVNFLILNTSPRVEVNSTTGIGEWTVTIDLMC